MLECDYLVAYKASLGLFWKLNLIFWAPKIINLENFKLHNQYLASFISNFKQKGGLEAWPRVYICVILRSKMSVIFNFMKKFSLNFN